MVVATRVMNLMSGILVLVSCICIELRFGSQLSEAQGLLLSSVGFVYFGYQFGRFVRMECTPRESSASYEQYRKLGLDITEQ
jgi:hypothetical protein